VEVEVDERRAEADEGEPAGDGDIEE